MKRLSILILTALGFFVLLHNIIYYPANGGYDFGLHSRYAKIISYEWRIPDLSENREAYNPPLFYLFSGLVGRLVSTLTGQDFVTSLKAWQYFNLLFALGGLCFWYKIYCYLFGNKNRALIAVGLLFCLPVFHKTVVMYTIEAFLFFIISFLLYFLLFYFFRKINLFNTFIVAMVTNIALLTRTSALIIPPIVVLTIIGLTIIKKINFSKACKTIFIFTVLIVIGSGWFYGSSKRPLNDDFYQIPKIGRTGFLTNVPFHLMMTHPIRLPVPLNQFIPIYYSEFWGDWWNYYSQTRFNVNQADIEKNHYLTSPKRVNSLAWQNRINILLTFLMISGFIYLLVKTLIKSFKKPDRGWLANIIFLSLTILTWLGFFYKLIYHATWKSDSIKASYMLYNLPIFVYFAVYFLFEFIKKYKLLFIPVIIWLTMSAIINLWWGWY